MKSKDNRDAWITRVNDFKSSQMTQVTWCDQNDVKVGALRYWIGKLSKQESVQVDDSDTSGFEFASVSVSEDQALEKAIAIHVDDVSISIVDDFDEFLLLKVIKTLRKP